MSRIPRIVVSKCPHHVTQCGNRREHIFFTDDDRQRFLDLLKEYGDLRGLRVQAYCLMPDHFHLVATPRTADALAAVLKPLLLRHAQQINLAQGVTGRLWQGRFLSCPLDERNFREAVRYVERSPVRARIVRKAERFPWSSAAAHCGLRDDPLLSGAAALAGKVRDWSAWLRKPADEAAVAAIRRCTRSGRPVGDDRFIARLERRFGRRLRALPVGRPRKTDIKPKRKKK